MRFFACAGRSIVTAATADHVAAQLWNPDSTRSLWVVEIHIAKTVATADHHGIARSSARGSTPTATVTPDLDNDFEREITPDTGAVLELATFSSQPTLTAPYMYRSNLPAAVGAGAQYVFPGSGIRVLPGTGLCVATPVATAMQPIDATFIFHE